MSITRRTRRILIANVLAVLSILAGAELFLRFHEARGLAPSAASKYPRQYRQGHLPDGRAVFYSAGADPSQGLSRDRVTPALIPPTAEEAAAMAYDPLHVEPAVFLAQKDPHRRRIILVGSSPIWGSPGLSPLNLSTHLYEEFRNRGSLAHLEIINAAVHQMDLADLGRLLDEVSDYSPDLIVVYLASVYPDIRLEGFSRESLSRPPWIFRLGRLAGKIRLFRLLRDAAGRGGADFSLTVLKSAFNRPGFYNEAVVNTLLNYRSLLQEKFIAMLDDYGRILAPKKSPALFLRVLTNTADLAPLASAHFRKCGAAELKAFAGFFEEGRRLMTQNETLKAEKALQRAYQIDPTYAECDYQLGQARLSGGDTAKYGIHSQPMMVGQTRIAGGDAAGAREMFRLAQDWDASPERFTSDTAAALKNWCEARRIQYLDLLPAMEKTAPRGVMGREYFRDLVHPTEDGLAAMARGLAEAILRDNFLRSSNDGNR